MKVLVACEFSAVVRDAFIARGHNAASCDLLSTEGDPEMHFRGDILSLLDEYPDQSIDLIIAHPECTRLALSGARWYKVPPPGKTLAQMEDEFWRGVAFYRTLRGKALRAAKRVAIENPIMLARAPAMPLASASATSSSRGTSGNPLSRLPDSSCTTCRRSSPRKYLPSREPARGNTSDGRQFIAPRPVLTAGKSAAAPFLESLRRWPINGEH